MKEEKISLKDLNQKNLVFDLREPIFSNTIMFNGVITSDFFNVGGGYLAFNILAGKEKEEMPLLLIKGEINDVKRKLIVGDKIAGIGSLKKIQEQFVIETLQINRIPTEKEIKELK